MQTILIVRYGEISLKGSNRHYFEDTLVKNLKSRLRSFSGLNFSKGDSRIYIDPGTTDAQTLLPIIAGTFGVVSVSIASRFEADLELIYANAREYVEVALREQPVKTFKVQSRRGNKSFPLESLEISRIVGAVILERFPQLEVDVHTPDLTVYVEVRDYAYVYTAKTPGPGGMPYGTNGKALLLISGGIDSPVAGWLMAKRGVALEALHFHSYPFTSERAQEKVFELTRILSRSCQQITLHSVNLLPVQQEIKAHCPEDYFTIISRRLMMFIAEQVALQHECQALITGENIGQVASQTIQSLHVTNSAVQLPVFRPLLAMDKMEIVAWSVKIGAYDVSIQPYEDCCTVFLPKRPVTKPRLDKVVALETPLNIPHLVEQALANIETHIFKA
ncbi:MAG TPA: tRNA uracil 4-sulfurtransferase ThiI [Bacillota bacterium]|nr:tRNA uracil 4-sulfurtransferase ThiI [Bacillota bacterium]